MPGFESTLIRGGPVSVQKRRVLQIGHPKDPIATTSALSGQVKHPNGSTSLPTVRSRMTRETIGDAMGVHHALAEACPPGAIMDLRTTAVSGLIWGEAGKKLHSMATDGPNPIRSQGRHWTPALDKAGVPRPPSRRSIHNPVLDDPRPSGKSRHPKRTQVTGRPFHGRGNAP